MSALLNLMIGLVLMYLTLALIVTAIQEAISGLLQWRAHVLSQNLRAMLTGADEPVTGSVAALVRQLSQGSKVPNPPAATATDALATNAVHDALLAHPLVSPTGHIPSYIASPRFALAMMDTVAKLAPHVQGAFSQFEAGVAALPKGRLQAALASITADAAGDVEKLKAGLASWFDDVMDRVSGIYKRWSAVVSFIIGALLALFLVADTIALLHHLASDPQFAGALAATAHTATASTASAATLDALGLSADPAYWLSSWSTPGAVRAHLLALVGCLITAIAISLGAPFWFDLLNSFLNIRSAGPVPPKLAAATTP